MSKILVKQCPQCGNEFSVTGQNHKFCSPECQTEHSKDHTKAWTNTYKLKKPEKQLLRSARHRAKERNIPFDISDADLPIPIVCPILNISLKVNICRGNGGRGDSYSLDRIDPTKGYTKGTVQVISHKANKMKSNATREELLAFAEWIRKTYT